jgi:hypothetical protein
MGKKRSRKTKSSKGVHTSVGKGSRVETTYLDKMLNKLTAWQKGKNPWVTVSVAGKDVSMRANAAWGDPRRRYNIYGRIREE